MPAQEHHRIFRIGWLRAAVLGANDGIVSTASLIAGVAASQVSQATILTTGIAALVAGSLSMAAGEYISVRSQADTEEADLQLESQSLRGSADQELEELIGIYVERGLTPDLAVQVAHQLTRHNALDAHARDELGISVHHRARPTQAALASACSFAAGAALPLLVATVAPLPVLIVIVSAVSLASLGLIGAIAAHAGGAPIGRAAMRVMLLGALAISATTGVGRLFGVTV